MSADMSAKSVPFEEDPPRMPEKGAHEADLLLLRIDGYEGPIEVLLELARNQKVDLAKVSILQLVRQYLEFIERAKAFNLELAAEYLVMAAWLTYLKSRLLLPKEESGEEPTAAEMAEALQFQLRRLEAMQKMAEKLLARPQLGQDFFPRGCTQEMVEERAVATEIRWDAGIYDLLKAYGDIRRRAEGAQYDLPVFNLMSTEVALERLTRMLGNLPRTGMGSVWASLQSFLPETLEDRLYARSALASTFTAGLELVKQGRAEIKQDGPFRPVYVRALSPQEELKTAEAAG